MLEGVKHAVARRALADLRREWEEAARSWAHLMAVGQGLDERQRAAVWSVLQSVQAALRGIEGALREARKDVEGSALRAVADTAHALATTRQLVEQHVIPYAEERIGYPPDQSRWKFVREG